MSPTARQTELDGQLTPLRNPLDSISWTDCPVERPPDTGSRDAAAPEFTLDVMFPTPTHWLGEAQATPLKMVMGMNSWAVALAEVVMKRVDPVAKPSRVSARIKEPIRMARVELIITCNPPVAERPMRNH